MDNAHIAPTGDNNTVVLNCLEGYRLRDGTSVKEINCVHGSWNLSADENCGGMFVNTKIYHDIIYHMYIIIIPYDIIHHDKIYHDKIIKIYHYII